jgi:hypothetical protein
MESEAKPNKAHHENGQKESLDPAKIAPTNLQQQVDRELMITEGNKQKRQSLMTLPFSHQIMC